MIIETTADLFAHWLEERTGLGAGLFETDGGSLSLGRAERERRPRGPDLVLMKAHLMVPSKDDPTTGILMTPLDGIVGISFRLTQLSPSRLEVVPECRHPAVLEYYARLMAEIESHWPDVSSQRQGQTAKRASPSRSGKRKTRYPSPEDKERRLRIARAAIALRDETGMGWKDIARKISASEDANVARRTLQGYRSELKRELKNKSRSK